MGCDKLMSDSGRAVLAAESGRGKAVPVKRPVAQRYAVWALLPLVVLGAAWLGRYKLLIAIGELLTSEDALQPVQVIVISTASAGATGALEAAQLYRDGFAADIVVSGSKPDPLLPAVHALGVPYLGAVELIKSILVRSGVPASAVHVLPDMVDGTDAESTAVARYAQQRRPASLLFVVARDHTARARWLLRRALPPQTRLLVRAPRVDGFRPDAWWRSRDESREVFMEYGRWFNSVILGDRWRPKIVSTGSANGAERR